MQMETTTKTENWEVEITGSLLFIRSPTSSNKAPGTVSSLLDKWDELLAVLNALDPMVQKTKAQTGVDG